MSKIIEACKKALTNIVNKIKKFFSKKTESTETTTESTTKTTFKQRMAVRVSELRSNVKRVASNGYSKVKNFLGGIFVKVADVYTTWSQVIFDVVMIALGAILGYMRVNIFVSILACVGYFFIHNKIVEKVAEAAIDTREDELENVSEEKINKALRDEEFRNDWNDLSDMSSDSQEETLRNNAKFKKLFDLVNSENYTLGRLAVAVGGALVIGLVGTYALPIAPIVVARAMSGYLFATLTLGTILPHVVNAIAGSRANKKASDIMTKIMNGIDSACERVDKAAKERLDKRNAEMRAAKYGAAKA